MEAMFVNQLNCVCISNKTMTYIVGLGLYVLTCTCMQLYKNMIFMTS